MSKYANNIMRKALLTIRKFRNLVQSNDIVDAREIEIELAQLLGEKLVGSAGLTVDQVVSAGTMNRDEGLRR